MSSHRSLAVAAQKRIVFELDRCDQKERYLLGRKPMKCVMAALLAAAIAVGQTTTARMVGTVRDRSGAVLPKVEVTARNVDTNIARQVRTDDTGDYVVTNLAVGRYEVTAQYPGFKRYVQGPITLEVEQTARV